MHESDTTLLTQYQEGNKASLEALFARYLPLTYNFLVRLTNNEYVAEEATSEAFLKAWKHLDSFQIGENFKPWIFRIARNTAYDMLRKRKLFVFSDFDEYDGNNAVLDTLKDPEPLPAEIFEHKLLAEKLKEVLEHLSPSEREVLHLYFEEGLTFNEIGVILGKPLDTVKSQERRAILKLRKLLLPLHH